MWAVLVVEQEPQGWKDLPQAVHTWILAAGGFATLAVLIWLLAQLLRLLGPSAHRPRVAWMSGFLSSLTGGAVIAVAVVAMPAIWYACGWFGQTTWIQVKEAFRQQMWYTPAYFVFGTALTAAVRPVVLHIKSLSWRRIWALARLSIKEAMRSRILWAFSGLLLVFLFASWFLPYKAENQVRNYVSVVFFAMTVLLLLTAGLLAAFSIPADLRRQTIHTIVTKPVERFEIVLGRFLGYTLLMSAVLAFMCLISLTYVLREIDEESREESLKARVPIFGELTVLPSGGVNVGREWNYRTYISGGVSKERAVWTFPSLPSHLGDQDTVRCEFAFDIFRTTKGEENKGVYATFLFENPKWKPELSNRFDEEWLKARREGEDDTSLNNRLAEKYGFFQAPSTKVEDYHTLFVEVPGALFRDLPKTPSDQEGKVPLLVTVRFESPTQYLGVARHDLYLLANERPFWLNFFKGAVGLWFRLCLVIGVAVTCSTYLSGVISFLSTMVLYILGMFLPFIKELAEGKNKQAYGGGPLQAMIRLGTNAPMAKELEDTPLKFVAVHLDQLFTLTLKPFLYLFPDVNRFNLTEYVAEGFDISTSKLMLDNFLPLAGYLLPWMVLAYYLVKSREIAS